MRGWAQHLPAISPAFGGLRDARSEFGRRAQVGRGGHNVGRLVEIALRHGSDKAAKAVQIFNAALGVVIAGQHAGVDPSHAVLTGEYEELNQCVHGSGWPNW